MKNVGYFLAHLTVSWLGIPFAVAPFMAFTLIAFLHQIHPAVSFRAANWILTETPFFPTQILLGLTCGFLLGRRMRHQVMLWTWTVPALSLVLAVAFMPIGPVIMPDLGISRLGHFFGTSCLPQNHCLAQLIVTMPFYSAAAYSFGAFMARIRMHPVNPSASELNVASR